MPHPLQHLIGPRQRQWPTQIDCESTILPITPPALLVDALRRGSGELLAGALQAADKAFEAGRFGKRDAKPAE